MSETTWLIMAQGFTVGFAVGAVFMSLMAILMINYLWRIDHDR